MMIAPKPYERREAPSVHYMRFISDRHHYNMLKKMKDKKKRILEVKERTLAISSKSALGISQLQNESDSVALDESLGPYELQDLGKEMTRLVDYQQIEDLKRVQT